eukprot:GHVQ01026697.1.p2 GENE.GHVQ01026697.1~~GHVQ01026697.1.p2  ORF type:complete len:103 (-),score=10.02 GHVQ01026697.1:715-1023(-)
MSSATEGKVLRWRLYLQQLDIQIRQIDGNCNYIAYWLSRNECYDDSEASQDWQLIQVPACTTLTSSQKTAPELNVEESIPYVSSLHTLTDFIVEDNLLSRWS